MVGHLVPPGCRWADAWQFARVWPKPNPQDFRFNSWQLCHFLRCSLRCDRAISMLKLPASSSGEGPLGGWDCGLGNAGRLPITGGGRKIQGPCCTTIGLTGALVHWSRMSHHSNQVETHHATMHVNVEIPRTCGFIILNGQEPEKSASNQKLNIFIWCFLMRKIHLRSRHFEGRFLASAPLPLLQTPGSPWG